MTLSDEGRSAIVTLSERSGFGMTREVISVLSADEAESEGKDGNEDSLHKEHNWDGVVLLMLDDLVSSDGGCRTKRDGGSRGEVEIK